ncbi:MAG TPA: ATP-binding cassette domain-containing protein [Solirubrobacteraceae bacterium]|nr:ATP-binding cassette domain-containing protein [Solirubrobacteraceae bacterium]
MSPAEALVPERAPGAEVVCAGVVHVYQGEETPIVALRNVELHVRAGEMLAVIGPSGSGKSTLLALLGGLLQPTAGAIIVGEHNMARLDARGLGRLRATELALLLQDPLQNLLPYATSLENIAFAQRGAQRRGWPLRWTGEELIETFGLGSVGRRPVHQISGGEQQRVAIASAMATSPRVLLADEPTARLDRVGRDAVIENLRRAHELSGATIIIVTHDTTLAESLPRTLGISQGVVGSERRAGRRFAVAGRDGSVQLPAEIASRFPAGTVFSVTMEEEETVRLQAETGLDEDFPSHPEASS